MMMTTMNYQLTFACYIQTVDENDSKSEVERNLKHLLRSHVDVFAKSSDDLGFCSLLEHDIDTGDGRQ